MSEEGHDGAGWERVDAAGDLVVVDCPWCGEPVELLLEPELEGEMVHDCEVCCRPWSLTVRRSGGRREAVARPA